MNAYVMAASFLGTSVEFVEALTIILAVGVVKGWKSSLLGALAATLLLTLVVLVFGSSLIHLVNLSLFQTLIGICMVLFGMRWLASFSSFLPASSCIDHSPTSLKTR
jgi:Ca2+/H+ antiporter, TMEM165/GDT1 family